MEEEEGKLEEFMFRRCWHSLIEWLRVALEELGEEGKLAAELEGAASRWLKNVEMLKEYGIIYSIKRTNFSPPNANAIVVCPIA
jgi:hypothetical protein